MGTTPSITVALPEMVKNDPAREVRVHAAYGLLRLASKPTRPTQDQRFVTAKQLEVLPEEYLIDSTPNYSE